MKYDVVIVASGKGVRANLGYNKVFHRMKDGRRVLDYSIDLFYEDEDCERIVVVTNNEDFDKVDNNEKVIVVEGGKERKDSVYNGLKEVKSEYVMVHDGARPFLHKETLEEIKDSLNSCDGVCLGHMATNTIKLIPFFMLVPNYFYLNKYKSNTKQFLV